MATGQRILYLYGVTTQPEVTGFLRTQCIFTSEAELQAVLESWRAAAGAFISSPSSPPDGPDSIRVEEFPKDQVRLLDPVKSDSLFQKSFAQFPTSIDLVEIDKIVAAQRYVNLDYVQRLESQIPQNPNLAFLVDFCLKRGSSVSPPAELQLGPNVYSYRSESTDFRFLGGYPKPLDSRDVEASQGGGEPVAAVVLLVGYGSPQVNLFQVGSRMILNNGFHRLFALRHKGVRKAPVVVQHITNVDLELPQTIIGLPTKYLVSSPRPSMLMDFLNPLYTRELLMKARDRSVQIQWGLNQVDIPK